MPSPQHALTLSAEDHLLILGALDSMAVALTDHGHCWTEGEREIYEQAIACLTSSADCRATDCEVLGKCPSQRLFVEPHPECDRVSSPLLALACSRRPSSVVVGLRLMSKPFRYFVWIYSWILRGWFCPRRK
jgi:hypothetical protein